MPIDHSSLMLAIGFSGTALSVTLFVAWLSARHEGFLLTWAAGMIQLVGGAVVFGVYTESEEPRLGLLCFMLLATGTATVYGAAREFRTHRRPLALIGALAGGSVGVIVPLFLVGWSGLGSAVGNAIVAVLLVASAVEYARVRRMAPYQLTIMIVLYATTGLSFLLCAAAILAKTPLTLDGPPTGWAEDLNAVMSIIGITGIGAISLALNQTRLAAQQRRHALTDALTGLVNRRALFESFAAGSPSPDTVVVVFDLDEFKRVNDRHGHAVGDEVLRRFTLSLKRQTREGDMAARFGGEEFALVLHGSSEGAALAVADRVISDFASDLIPTESGPIRCTASAGVAVPDGEADSYETLLARADHALYAAKRGGRNRVVSPAIRPAA
jgi:diguanylate cyclase (GGDEF)-like protein